MFQPYRLCGCGLLRVQRLQDLIESWNGTSWSVVANPSITDSSLTGVSCVRATECVAVGGYENSKGDEVLTEAWNATRWSVTPSPKIASNGPIGLSGVSCTTSTSCMAVGSHFVAGNAKALVISWNGKKWSVVPSPNTTNQHIVDLEAVSCTSPTSCVAVGSYDETLIESWNGKEWSIVSSPNKGDGGGLNDVSCPTVAKCVAVGYYALDNKVTGFVTKTLVEGT